MLTSSFLFRRFTARAFKGRKTRIWKGWQKTDGCTEAKINKKSTAKKRSKGEQRLQFAKTPFLFYLFYFPLHSLSLSLSLSQYQNIRCLYIYKHKCVFVSLTTNVKYILISIFELMHMLSCKDKSTQILSAEAVTNEHELVQLEVPTFSHSVDGAPTAD